MTAPISPDAWPLWHYRGTLIRCKDGDTAVIRIDLGFSAYQEIAVRIDGYNAPELHGPDRDRALAAKAELESILAGRPLYLTTRKDSRSFERYLARVYVLRDGNGLYDVASLMAAYNVPQGQ